MTLHFYRFILVLAFTNKLVYTVWTIKTLMQYLGQPQSRPRGLSIHPGFLNINNGLIPDLEKQNIQD